MSLDPRLSVPPERVSAIENELPSYRAISSLAITSLVFGALTILGFADDWFLICGALAVLFGLLALRRIRRLPDLLIGRGLAQAGIALGLAFGLSAVTVSVTQSLKIRQSARLFSEQYAQLLKTSDLAHAAWYRLPYEDRKNKTAEEHLEDVTERSAVSGFSADVHLGPLSSAWRRVKEQGWSIRLLEIEQHGYDRVTPYAFACYELDPPAGAKETEPEYAMIEVRSDGASRTLNWYISEFDFPYTPKSHQLKVVVDDGHGHSH